MKIETTFANTKKKKKKLCLEMLYPRFIGIRVLLFILFISIFLVLKVWLIFSYFFGIYSLKNPKFPKMFFHHSAKIDKRKRKEKQTNKH